MYAFVAFPHDERWHNNLDNKIYLSQPGSGLAEIALSRVRPSVPTIMSQISPAFLFGRNIVAALASSFLLQQSSV